MHMYFHSVVRENNDKEGVILAKGANKKVIDNGGTTENVSESMKLG